MAAQQQHNGEEEAQPVVRSSQEIINESAVAAVASNSLSPNTQTQASPPTKPAVASRRATRASAAILQLRSFLEHVVITLCIFSLVDVSSRSFAYHFLALHTY
jgi:hypothetical protein